MKDEVYPLQLFFFCQTYDILCHAEIPLDSKEWIRLTHLVVKGNKMVVYGKASHRRGNILQS